MRVCLLLIYFFLSRCSTSQHSISISEYGVGNDTFNFHLTVRPPYSSAVSFINLHDDENTSVKAGEHFISEYGGSLLQLQHTGKRNFSFMLNGQTFSFDPNRIFTSNGLKA